MLEDAYCVGNDRGKEDDDDDGIHSNGVAHAKCANRERHGFLPCYPTPPKLTRMQPVSGAWVSHDIFSLFQYFFTFVCFDTVIMLCFGHAPTSTADPMLSRYTASSTTRRKRRTTHSRPGRRRNCIS